MAKSGKPVGKSKPPLILCDVGGTLLGTPDDPSSTTPNQQLITLLNRAKQQGFEIQLITGGVDTGTYWSRDCERLKATKLDSQIIEKAAGKENIRPNTYSDVVAVIDDDSGIYIRDVTTGNPDTKHFKPDQIEQLTRHLQTVKPKGAKKGAAE